MLERIAEKVDYSTINLERLRELPIFTGAFYQMGKMGLACELDPPGYPSYFQQGMYDSEGLRLATVIGDPETGLFHVVDGQVRGWSDDQMHRHLWIAPPLDSMRVWVWQRCLYLIDAGMQDDDGTSLAYAVIRQWYPEAELLPDIYLDASWYFLYGDWWQRHATGGERNG